MDFLSKIFWGCKGKSKVVLSK